MIYPFVVFGIIYAVESGRNLSRGLLLFLVAGMVFAVLLALYGGITRPAYTLIGRTFFSVALNHFDYYQFFQSNPFLMWSNSFLKHFIVNPYDVPVPALIGVDRWGRGGDAFANAGYVASGYMHLGLLGVLLYSVILGLLFKLYDWLVLGRTTLSLGLVVSALAILQVVNVDLTTALLSQGIAVSLLVLFLLGARQRTPTNNDYRLTQAGLDR